MVNAREWVARPGTRSQTAGGKPKQKSRRRYRPLLESLEDRTLPAITVFGIPQWIEQGPGPITGGQVEGIPDQPVVGAIQDIAGHPTNPTLVYVATVNGGVWRTDPTSITPVWTPLTDEMPSLSTSAIALALTPNDNPLSTADDVLYVGLGRFSNGARMGAPHTGLYKS